MSASYLNHSNFKKKRSAVGVAARRRNFVLLTESAHLYEQLLGVHAEGRLFITRQGMLPRGRPIGGTCCTDRCILRGYIILITFFFFLIILSPRPCSYGCAQAAPSR